MAERLGSKRGGYAGSKPITISYNLIDGYRVLKKPESPQLTKINRERNKYSRIIRKNRTALLGDAKGEERKKIERWINQQTYGTKLKKGVEVEKPKVKDVNVSALIKENQEAYKARKPLDAEAKKLRKNEDYSDKIVSDAIRYSQKQKLGYTYINNQRVYISQIQELKKLSVVNGSIKEVVYGYKLPSDIFKGQSNNKAQFKAQISNKHFENVVKTRDITKRRGTTEAITFYNDGQIYTDTNIKKLFDEAQRKTGARIIFINNVAVSEDAFIEKNGVWYLEAYISPNSLGLNVSFGEQTTARVSFEYNRNLTYTTFDLERKEAKEKIRHIYKEITTIVSIGNNDEKYTVHLIIMSYSTIQQIFQAQKIAYISGNKEKRFITITKFKIMKSDYLEAQKELKKLNAKNSLLLTPEERQRMEQLQAIAKTDLVIECYDSELLTEEQATSLQNKDEFIILSIGDLRGEADKLKNQLFVWEVAIKSPRIGEILGIFETTGES